MTLPRTIVGALSAWQYPPRRRRCRESWLADAADNPNLDVVFLMGAADRVSQPVRIDDLLLLPCPNEYKTLPQRTRWFCRWAVEQGEFEYLFKCDDDTYVAIDRLAAYDPAGRDYIGAEWSKGVDYGSGGGGYLLSRRAAQVVAEKLTHEEGAEDELVGRVLREAGIRLFIENRFTPYAGPARRPRPDNDLITAHAVSGDLLLQSHREVGAGWAFRICMVTTNGSAKKAPPVSLQLLRRYWPGHPRVDLVFHDVEPLATDQRVHRLRMGPRDGRSWSRMLLDYLEQYNRDPLVLLMLDDYGLCRPAQEAVIRQVQDQMLADPRIGNVHLTWQPAQPKTPLEGLLRLPPWGYSVNTQAAIWRRDLLLRVLAANAETDAVQFEVQGSRWFNEHRYDEDLHCQVVVPEPSQPSDFVDTTDKTHWVLPYHNLLQGGSVADRHREFLSAHGLSID